MDLSDRDRAILRDVTERIRLATFAQLARNYWPAGEAGRTNARRRLDELVARDLLARVRVVAHPLLELTAPVVAWRPGGARPDIGRVAAQLQERWQGEPRETGAYLAGRRAVVLLGARAPGRVRNPYQVTHDLHVSEVYFGLRRSDPTLADAWVGEEVIAPTRKDQKLPDAILYDGEGRPRIVIEFGGKYPARRVAAFHDDCEARGLPYELW